MKRRIVAAVLLGVLIFVCTSGLVEPITKVFVWLITLQLESPDISIFGQLVAKYGTWIITYSLVGILFEEMNWFNGTVMKIVYFVVSTVISFLLSWLIMVLEHYMVIIAIIIGSILALGTIAFVTWYLIKKRKTKESKPPDVHQRLS